MKQKKAKENCHGGVLMDGHLKYCRVTGGHYTDCVQQKPLTPHLRLYLNVELKPILLHKSQSRPSSSKRLV